MALVTVTGATRAFSLYGIHPPARKTMVNHSVNICASQQCLLYVSLIKTSIIQTDSLSPLQINEEARSFFEHLSKLTTGAIVGITCKHSKLKPVSITLFDNVGVLTYCRGQVQLRVPVLVSSFLRNR